MAITLSSYCPATGEIVGTVEASDISDIGPMVDRCREVQRTWWSTSDAKQRKFCLNRLLEMVIEQRDELARLVSSETGKPLMESLNSDVLASVTMIHWCASQTGFVDGVERLPLGRLGPLMRVMGRHSKVARQPLGVIGIISPWNFPLAIPLTQIAMAVAAGNAVLLKPSPLTPLIAAKLPSMFTEAGFPEGLVTVAQGGDDIGRALTASDVDGVIFTGSWRAGMDVMRTASDRLTPVTLELGGKDPMVILEDCDLERAVAGAVWGAFVNAGQVCAAVKRIVVHRSIHARFLSALTEQVMGLRIGYDPDDPDIDMGPLIEPAAVERMAGVVDLAVSQGARLVCGGGPLDAVGNYFPPTILDDVVPGMDVFRKEVFGPVVTVTAFEDDDEAVALANDSDFALSASVWTRDLKRGRDLADRIHGGTVSINNAAYTYGLPTTPWGGSGLSGFGRSHGLIGMEGMTRVKHIHEDRGRFAHDLWWQPYDGDKRTSLEGLMDIGYAKGGWRRLSMLPSMLGIMRRGRKKG